MNVVISLLLIVMLNSSPTSVQEQDKDDFWNKYRYCIRIMYVENGCFKEFLNIASKNKGNKIFKERLVRELVYKCSIKSTGDAVHALPADKKIYNKLVLDTSVKTCIDTKKYYRDDRFALIRIKDDSSTAIGFVPYYCILKLPKFRISQKEVRVYEYIEKNEAVKDYIKKINNVFRINKDYKFKMDENGVIWVYFAFTAAAEQK